MESIFVDLTLEDEVHKNLATAHARLSTPKIGIGTANQRPLASSASSITRTRKRPAPSYLGNIDIQRSKKRRLGTHLSSHPAMRTALSSRFRPQTQASFNIQPESWNPITVHVHARNSRRRPIDLTNELEPDLNRRLSNSSNVSTRAIQKVFIRGLAFQPEGVTFEVGMDVELNDWSFLRILRIDTITKPFVRTLLQGHRLFRPNAFNDTEFPRIIPEARNELVYVPHKTTAVLPTKVIRISNIIFTNERDNWGKAQVLTCRLKVTRSLRVLNGLNGSNRGDSIRDADWMIRGLTFEEADPGRRIMNKQVRERWRGPTKPFGEGKTNIIIDTASRIQRPSEIIDLENPVPAAPPTPMTVIDLTAGERSTYTFGDAFCGAGGASCGARQAGLQIKWAFDLNKDAIESYSMNFPDVNSRCIDAFRFFPRPHIFLRVDVMHASPPCQTYSPAHTVNNEENDDRNSACLHGIRNAVERVKPRIFTMEETFGLDRDAHRPSLHRVVMDLVELGYSVRWEIIKLGDHGVPQTRKRLILIAAGPGETLFPFPPATYGGLGQPRLRTIRDAIYDLPDDAPNHDVEYRLSRWEREFRRPLDWDEQAKTVTTAGGQDNYHPSGRRTFTDREIACLQTFPRDYKFCSRGTRRQIGNAFPPMAAKTIYEAARKSLRETDEDEQEQKEI